MNSALKAIAYWTLVSVTAGAGWCVLCGVCRAWKKRADALKALYG